MYLQACRWLDAAKQLYAGYGLIDERIRKVCKEEEKQAYDRIMDSSLKYVDMYGKSELEKYFGEITLSIMEVYEFVGKKREGAWYFLDQLFDGILKDIDTETQRGFERSQKAKGLILFEEKWMLPSVRDSIFTEREKDEKRFKEEQKRKGLVWFEGQWLTPEARDNILERRNREIERSAARRKLKELEAEKEEMIANNINLSTVLGREIIPGGGNFFLNKKISGSIVCISTIACFLTSSICYGYSNSNYDSYLKEGNLSIRENYYEKANVSMKVSKVSFLTGCAIWLIGTTDAAITASFRNSKINRQIRELQREREKIKMEFDLGTAGFGARFALSF